MIALYIKDTTIDNIHTHVQIIQMHSERVHVLNFFTKNVPFSYRVHVCALI